MSTMYTPTTPEYTLSPTEADRRAKMPYWQAAIEAGKDDGRKEFYDDPDMQALRARRQELAKGYDSGEMGALRGSARSEIQGQRQNYMNQMRSNLARGGVGGARGAAMQGAANQKFAQGTMDNERKMALDSAQMKRQGATDLQDFLFRQKFGTLATGMGYGQMAAADRAADATRSAAGSGGGGGLSDGFLNTLGNISLGPLGWKLSQGNGLGVGGSVSGMNWSF